MMMLSGALYMAMPLAIIGSKFDEAYKDHEEHKELQSKKWAEAQMRRLQNVTRKTRRARALHLGYQIAEEVGELVDRSEADSAASAAAAVNGQLDLGSERVGVLAGLFEDAGLLAIDLNVLFGLNYHDTKADELSQRKARKGTEDGVSLGGAFWNNADPFLKRKGDDLSEAEQRALALVEAGKSEIAEMHNLNELYLKKVTKAIESSSLRDRVWLCTDVPKSSKCAKAYHWFSLVMTFMSIILFLAETTPEFNDYRQGGRVCKEVVAYHCKQVILNYENDPAALVANKGCFSRADLQMLVAATGANVTESPLISAAVVARPLVYERMTLADYNARENLNMTEEVAVAQNLCTKNKTVCWVPKQDQTKDEEQYQGCWSKEGFTTAELDAKCHWPAPELGLSCNMHGELDSLKDQGLVSNDTVWADPFNREWALVQKGNDEHAIDICNREQCVDNAGTDWAETFMVAEIVFAAWFVVELFLRLFSTRDYKAYFSQPSNIFDIGAVVISCGEAVYLPILLGGPYYEVWGNPWGDPAVMRFLRILVTIRFITMQRHFSGLKVIQMTVRKVAGKMKIPIFFFFVFAVVFASFFYIIESGELYVKED